MGYETAGAVLYPVRSIGIITAAQIAKSIKGAVAEQTVEIVRIDLKMTGKKFTFPVLKEIIMGHMNLREWSLQICFRVV